MNKFGIFLRVLLPLTFLALGFAQSASGQTSTLAEDMAAVLKTYTSLSPRPFHLLRVSEARMQPTLDDAMMALLARSNKVPSKSGLDRSYDLELKTAAADLPARVYKPFGPGTLPIIIYFHGGGWVVGDLDVYETSAVALAKRTEAIVLAVEYRKAPEHKFPAAHDDAFNAYKWVLNNGASFGGDVARIAVAGEGAGGNLAMNVAIRARNEKLPPPRHVLAIYPIADGTGKTASYFEAAQAQPLNRATMMWFLAQYVHSGREVLDSRISLVRADVKNLPPTTILTAEIDPLKSEGIFLFDKLKFAGVAVELRNYPGVTHDFFGLADVVAEARAAQAYGSARIKASFRASQ